MDRQQAWELVCEYTASDSLRKHMLALEAAVRAYARQFGEDENESLIVHLEFGEAGKKLRLVPARIEGYFPRVANVDEGVTTLARLAEWSDENLKDEILNGTVNW